MRTATTLNDVSQSKPMMHWKSVRHLYWVVMAAAVFGDIMAVRAPANSEAIAAPTATNLGTVIVPAAIIPAKSSGQDAPPGLSEKNYSGIIEAIDPKEHVLTVKGAKFSTKEFNLGDNCVYTFLYTMLLDNDAAVNNLRRGEKIMVSYRDAQGVLIADHIEQQPMQFTGIVKRIDPNQHTLVLRQHFSDKQLDIAVNCITMRSNEQAGSLADIHPGDHVTVLYEAPNARVTAWQITKTTLTPPAR